MRYLILLTAILWGKSLSASSTHCNTLSGWYFYCDPEKEEVAEEKPQSPLPQSTPAPKSDAWYVERLKNIQETLALKKTKMVIEPTEAHVREYIEYQRMVLDMASTGTDQWQRVLWKTPELDYTIKKPVSKIGKETYLDERRLDKQRTLEALSRRYGVFFAFRSDCPFCHRFAPVVKMLEERGFNIIPISMDGGYLPEFSPKQTKMNTGQLANLGINVEVVPALFLFDAANANIVPIGFGFMAFDEVEERIYALTKEVGEDYK